MAGEHTLENVIYSQRFEGQHGGLLQKEVNQITCDMNVLGLGKSQK